MKENDKVNKKQLIIKTAKEVILKKGYQKTTIENITKAANISKGSLYTYFKSKDILLLEILEEILEAMKESDNKFFLTENRCLENKIFSAIEKRFYLENNRLMNILFLVNLTSNLEVLGYEIREKLILAKKYNVDFWINIFSTECEALNFSEKEIKNYAILIDDIIYSSVKKVIFYSHDTGVYITELSLANEKIRSQEVKEEIKFIYKVILNILKGER